MDELSDLYGESNRTTADIKHTSTHIIAATFIHSVLNAALVAVFYRILFLVDR